MSAQKQQPKTKAISPIDELRRTFAKMEDQFRLALPPHVPVEKFIRTVMTAVQGNQDLVQADRATLFTACLECATDGLLPDGREAAIVTFKNNKKGTIEAGYMPMVGGLLKMMRNSGEIATVFPNIVCANDEFSYWIDENGEHIKHEPNFDDRGALTHAYVIARMKDGSVTTEVMSHAEIEKVRACAKAKDSGPWRDWYGEMAKKTVLRRVSKRLPSSTEIEKALERDDKFYDLDAPRANEGTKKSRLETLVGAKQAALPAPASSEEAGDTSAETADQ
jgi:recombination protein RecT